MRRRLNLKVLAILVVTVVVLGTGTHFLHGYQVERNAKAFLRQADLAEGKGDFDRAVVYLNRGVRQAGRSPSEGPHPERGLFT